MTTWERFCIELEALQYLRKRLDDREIKLYNELSAEQDKCKHVDNGAPLEGSCMFCNKSLG